MAGLKSFFNPKTIAVVGASPNRKKLGNVLIRNITESRWKGKLFFVNPRHKKIMGARCYPSLGVIGQKIDLALIAIPAQLVNEAVLSGAQGGPKVENFIIISSGFKETGKEGLKAEEDLENISRKFNLNVLGPNCLGFINPKMNLNASFTSGKFQTGKVSIVSQSGALAVALLDWTQNMSVGFSKVISIGNKAVLDESDVVDYLATDETTKVIALYLEDIKDGEKFMSAISKVSQKKPIVILKAGKTRLGQKAISSHTGSLAQDEAIVSAVFEKMNVIEAGDIAEFQDLLLYLSADSIPQKKEVIVLTNAGGPGVLASDYIGKSKSIKLLSFPGDFKEELRKDLPKSASAENPIDLIGDAAPDRYEKAMQKISWKYPKNPLLLILTPQSQTNPDEVAKISVRYKNRFQSLATCFMGGVKISQSINYLHQNNIANFENPERALLVIEKLIKYSELKEKPLIEPRKANRKPPSKISVIISATLKEKRKMLYWEESEKIFNKYGLKLTPSLFFKNISEATKKISYPCVLKTDEPAIIHRWDKKAVILGIKNEKELKRSFESIRKSTKAERFLVQPMVSSGLEMIIGLKGDRTFGPVLVCGLGGTYAELFKDRVIFISPKSEHEVVEKLSQLRIFPLLQGFRGEKGYPLREIAKIILSLQKIAVDFPEIREIDINPLVIYNNKRPCRILDVKVYL